MLSPDLVSLRPPAKSTGCTGVSHEQSGGFDLRYQCSRELAENLNSILVREEVPCEFVVCHVHVECVCTGTLACVCTRLQMHPYKCHINGVHPRRQGNELHRAGKEKHVSFQGLECSSPNLYMAHSFASFKSLFKCPLLMRLLPIPLKNSSFPDLLALLSFFSLSCYTSPLNMVQC